MSKSLWARTVCCLRASLNYSEDERRKSWTKTFHSHRKSWQDKKLNTFITSIGRTKQTIFVKAVLTSTQAPYMFRLMLMLTSLVSREQAPNCSKGRWCYQLDKFQWKWRNDRRSERNLCNCVKKPEKNSLYINVCVVHGAIGFPNNYSRYSDL